MTERMIMITIFGSGILYSIGGLGTPPFGKGWRRYGIPLLFLGASLITGSINLKVIGTILLTCGALHLGYGSNSNWLMKIIYALAITLPSLLIKFNFWMIILPIVFLGTFYLSNKPKWQYIFNWRICEAITGFVMGILWSQIL